MNYLQGLLLLWALTAILHLSLVVVVYREQRSVSLLASGGAGLVSIAALALLVWVFFIGRSSNVAQIAGESGADLWSFWFTIYIPLLIACAAGLLVSITTLAFPPYPPRSSTSFCVRVGGVISLVLACAVLLRVPPDA